MTAMVDANLPSCSEKMASIRRTPSISRVLIFAGSAAFALSTVATKAGRRSDCSVRIHVSGSAPRWLRRNSSERALTSASSATR